MTSSLPRQCLLLLLAGILVAGSLFSDNAGAQEAKAARPTELSFSTLAARYEGAFEFAGMATTMELHCAEEGCSLRDELTGISGQFRNLTASTVSLALLASVQTALRTFQSRHGYPAEDPQYQGLKGMTDAVLPAASTLASCAVIDPDIEIKQLLCTVEQERAMKAVVLLFYSNMGKCHKDYCEYLIFPLVEIK